MPLFIQQLLFNSQHMLFDRQQQMFYVADMALGIHIRRRLKELNWEQKDLVEATRPNPDAAPQVSQQNLSALIKRNSKRTMYLQAIADGLRLTTTQLLSGQWNKPNSSEPKDSPLYNPSRTEMVIFAIVKSLSDEEQEEFLKEARSWHAAHALSQKHVKGGLRPIGNVRMLGQFGTPERKAAAKSRQNQRKPEGK